MDNVPATRKLYLEDAYTVSFQAMLLACTKLPDGRTAAVLDQTYFYPTSGGQLADRGTIENIEVTDVWEDDSGIVFHAIADELPPGAVRCHANWERRFDHMQQHTGQHVLSRAFIEVARLNTISFHMGSDACTIDIDGGELTEETLDSAEALSNKIIWEDREVTVKNVARSELKQDALRKKLPAGVEQVRLVEVTGFDVIGCCGTHVRRAGELGAIKVLKSERSKGAHRVTFKVGQRAYRDFCAKHDLLKRLSLQLTTGAENLGEKVDKLQTEAQHCRKESQKLQKRLAALEADALVSTAESEEGRRYVRRVFGGYDEGYLKMLASELRSKDGTIGLIGTDGGTVICCAAKDVAISFAKSVVERAQSLGGGGGGEGSFATVRLPKNVSVAEFLDRVIEDIKRG